MFWRNCVRREKGEEQWGGRVINCRSHLNTIRLKNEGAKKKEEKRGEKKKGTKEKGRDN